MRGAISTTNVALLLISIALVLMAFLLAYGLQIQVNVAQPLAERAMAEPAEETVTVNLWDVLVRVYDVETNAYVMEANIWLLYEKPKNIYETPTSNIFAAELNVNGRATFTGVDTGRTFYALAAASGYYNGGKEFSIPKEMPKKDVEARQPYVVDIYLDPKGTILGVQVPLTYRGSSADIAKLVYNADTDAYETEFSFVVSTDGVVKYNKVTIELNTDNLGTATIDTLTVKIGDDEYTYDNVIGSKTIRLDEERTLAAGSTLPVTMTVQGSGLDAVSGELFKVVIYDVQEGNWMAVVEGPA